MTNKKSFKKVKFNKFFGFKSLCAVLAATILVAAVVTGCGAGKKWGKGITKDIPEFNGKADSVVIDEKSGYGAAYYSNVTTEQIDEYISQIEQDCGVTFNGDKYPRSAISGDRIITIHYNVTEMNFSVTVTAKTYNSYTSGETK